MSDTSFTYEAVVDGDVVWSETHAEPHGKDVFPAEYRTRPDEGVVELRVNGETIAVQRPMTIDEMKAFISSVPAAPVDGAGDITLEDAAGTGA